MMRPMKLSALLSSLALGGLVAACVVKSSDPGTPGGGGGGDVTVRDHRTGNPQPEGVVEIVDENGTPFQISQGAPGEPGVVGCADGQREALVDAAIFPGVAGCIGEWTGVMSMRAAATGAACGDDLGPCGAPADACAPGWHLCGVDGGLAEIDAIGGESCASAGGGRFVAAASHCATQSGCEYADPATGRYECFESGWCSEPICCGDDCQFGSCPGGVWPEQTKIAIGTDQGCGAIGSSRARGVLCCRD